MTLENFTYLGLLIFSISYPLYKSFEEKIQMHTKWKEIWLSIVIVAVPFLIWDVIFERIGIWSFSNNYTLGLRILNLPIEEWLFFFFVPYACVFIYEVLNYFFKSAVNSKILRSVLIVFTVIMAVVSYLFHDRIYTFTIALTIFFLLLFQLLFINPEKNWKIFSAFLISLIPFLIVNGVLTYLPVVSYNDAENSSFRIFTIPIEDTGYLYILLTLNFILIDFFRKKLKKE